MGRSPVSFADLSPFRGHGAGSLRTSWRTTQTPGGPSVAHAEILAKLGDIAAAAGLRRIHVLAWRDLDDVEAGGSEVHAATVARLWAEAGIEVTMRTSYAQGHPPVINRDGYRVVRRAGRYMVFPRAALQRGQLDGTAPATASSRSGTACRSSRRSGPAAPASSSCTTSTPTMWKMVLPPNLATFGETIERRIAPPLYRRSRIVTLSESSRRELVDELGFRPDARLRRAARHRPRFSVGGERADAPARRRRRPAGAGEAVRRAHPGRWPRCDRHIPTPSSLIVGDGYERETSRRWSATSTPPIGCRLPGRLSDDALVDLYRRAWVLASASAAEGWGMTITEAAACGTPAVVTDIAGHRDAVADGVTACWPTDMRDLARDISTGCSPTRPARPACGPLASHERAASRGRRPPPAPSRALAGEARPRRPAASR